MIPVPSGVRVWLAVGRTDMRRGMNGLALQVQETLGRDPFAGDLFVFRGARGRPDQGPLARRPRPVAVRQAAGERGRFMWPSVARAASQYRPRSSPMCSTGLIGVTRFIHSVLNARDSCAFCERRTAVCERWPAFTRFLDDGCICASNNAAKRGLRGIALGRKSWLFAGSDRGGMRAAAMYSLIVTAKLCDIDPQAWLADVLARIAGHPTRRLDELLPWNWIAAKAGAQTA